MRVPLAALALLLLPRIGAAGDGVLEINQVCAEQTGCFPGDTQGFPVTIDAIARASSFRLTSDLTVPDLGTTAIRIEVTALPGVSLDLAGFALRGPNQCSGNPLVCTGTGGGRGIWGRADRVSVRDGDVSGFGNAGLDLARSSAVLRVRASQNGSRGISVGDSGRIDGCVSESNLGEGFFGTSGAIVTHSAATGNRFEGFEIDSDCTIESCTATSNQSTGFQFGSCHVSGSVARFNRAGFDASGAAVLVDSVAGNSFGGGANSFGIRCFGNCSARGNNVQFNEGTGMALSVGATYRENTVGGNTAGQVSGGVNLGDNYCAGNGAVLPTCP